MMAHAEKYSNIDDPIGFESLNNRVKSPKKKKGRLLHIMIHAFWHGDLKKRELPGELDLRPFGMC
jgi:hypothetical protein